MTATRNTSTKGESANNAGRPVSFRVVEAVPALVVAASKPRPSSTLPTRYSTVLAASITTIKAYGSGLLAAWEICLKTCTGVTV